MVSLEKIMHEGMIPGFYDGQFSSLWEIPLPVHQRLVKMASEEDCHYIVRVLAIMALSENKRQNLEKELEGLILPARAELFREWLVFRDLRSVETITPELIEESRRIKLSGYARYSLAKAGYDRHVRAMIHEMKEWIRKRRTIVDERRIFKGVFGRKLRLEQEFSRNLYFDIGYEYQQLDDYENAELWYKKLINSFPDTEGISNAHYNLACLYSIWNRTEKAIHHLERSVEEGFLDFSWMAKDRDLDNIRHLPRFISLREKVFSEKQDKRGEQGNNSDIQVEIPVQTESVK